VSQNTSFSNNNYKTAAILIHGSKEKQFESNSKHVSKAEANCMKSEISHYCNAKIHASKRFSVLQICNESINVYCFRFPISNCLEHTNSYKISTDALFTAIL
jgi:hypothetical protein